MPYAEDDQSASTARFRAFAQRQDDDLPPAWEMRAPRQKVWLLAGIVIGVAVLVAIFAIILIAA